MGQPLQCFMADLAVLLKLSLLDSFFGSAFLAVELSNSSHNTECLVKLSACFPKNSLLKARELYKDVNPCSQFVCIYFQKAQGT